MKSSLCLFLRLLMEKPPLKAAKGNQLLKFLPRATSFSVPNPAYSPGREKTHARRGFSGPIVPMFPAEAGRKPPGRGYETPEPSSPKVSCIGQIKQKKKICRLKKSPSSRKDQKPRFSISKVFRIKPRSGGSSAGAGPTPEATKPPRAPERVAAPPLGQLRRFASGRDSLGNFDWRSQRVASDESAEDRWDDCTSGRESDDDEDGAKIPHSAPMAVGGSGAASEPRKEATLWRKRTMTPLRPLQIG